MDELIIDGKTYVSSKRAAQISGYAKDYVGQLCREGRIEARTVGRSWYVLLETLEGHRLKDAREEAPREEVPMPIEPKSDSVTDTWSSPRYVPERLASMPSISDRPSHINKLYAPSARDMHAEARVQEELVSQMQDAWKEWFDHRAAAAEAAVESSEEDREEQGSREEAVPETREEQEVPVRVERSYEEEPGDSPSEEIEEETASVAVRRIPDRRAHPAQRQAESNQEAQPSPYGRFMVQAVFLALSVVALATALVGTDIINVSGLDFLAGVESINDK